MANYQLLTNEENYLTNEHLEVARICLEEVNSGRLTENTVMAVEAVEAIEKIVESFHVKSEAETMVANFRNISTSFRLAVAIIAQGTSEKIVSVDSPQSFKAFLAENKQESMTVMQITDSGEYGFEAKPITTTKGRRDREASFVECLMQGADPIANPELFRAVGGYAPNVSSIIKTEFNKENMFAGIVGNNVPMVLDGNLYYSADDSINCPYVSLTSNDQKIIVKRELIALGAIPMTVVPGSSSTTKAGKLTQVNEEDIDLSEIYNSKIFKEFKLLWLSNQRMKAIKVLRRLGLSTSPSNPLCPITSYAVCVKINGEKADIMLNDTEFADGEAIANVDIITQSLNDYYDGYNFERSSLLGAKMQFRNLLSTKDGTSVDDIGYIRHITGIMKSQNLSWKFYGCDKLEDCMLFMFNSTCKYDNETLEDEFLELLSMSKVIKKPGKITGGTQFNSKVMGNQEATDIIVGAECDYITEETRKTYFSFNENKPLEFLHNMKVKNELLKEGETENSDSYIKAFMSRCALSTIRTVNARESSSLRDIFKNAIAGKAKYTGLSSPISPALNGILPTDDSAYIPFLGDLLDNFELLDEALASGNKAKIRKYSRKCDEINEEYIVKEDEHGYYILTCDIKFPAQETFAKLMAKNRSSRSIARAVEAMVEKGIIEEENNYGVYAHYAMAHNTRTFYLDKTYLKKLLAGADYDMDKINRYLQKNVVYAQNLTKRLLVADIEDAKKKMKK